MSLGSGQVTVGFTPERQGLRGAANCCRLEFGGWESHGRWAIRAIKARRADVSSEMTEMVC